MADTVSVDVSHYQTSVTDAYNRQFLIFRIGDGTTMRDRNYNVNVAWAKKAYASGRITGFVGYHVYRPGAQSLYNFCRSIVGPTLPAGMALMIDAESWGGQITGNRSSDLNVLYGLFSHWAGSFNRVIGYGNKSDLAGLWPQRDPRCKVILASYGTRIVTGTISGAIGQQYTDGQYAGPPGLPIATPPFGKCDHNVFPGLSPQQLAQTLGLSTHPAAPIAPILIKDVEMFMIRNSTSGGVELYVGNGQFQSVSAADYPVLQKSGVIQYNFPPAQYGSVRASLVATKVALPTGPVTSAPPTSTGTITTDYPSPEDIANAVRAVLASTPLTVTGNAS